MYSDVPYTQFFSYTQYDHEGAPLPYFNGTVHEKLSIVRYLLMHNRIVGNTEHYRTVPIRQVPDMIPNTDPPNKLDKKR